MPQVSLIPTPDDATYQFQVSHEDGWSVQGLFVATNFGTTPGATLDDAMTFIGQLVNSAADITSFNLAKFSVDTTILIA